jgi:hypothetical protein
MVIGGTILGGIIGSQVASKAPIAVAHLSRTQNAFQALRGFAPSGQFGIGYTGGAYLGYGVTNTWDPFAIHKPKYKYSSKRIRMPYGYGYGRYRRRYSRFRRRRYSRYSRFYRRRRYY